ncbi:eCIS core domain-containing protein [Streptomyces sp. NPDC002643]
MRDRSRDEQDGGGRGSVRVAPRRVDAGRTAESMTAAGARQDLPTGLRQGLPTTPAGFLALQRLAGNAAVSRAVTAQRHAAGGPGHRCEEEAERTGGPSEPVRRSTSVHEVLGTSGRPLPGPVRQDMEARFGGTDFGDVRVHDDAAARRSAQEIGARAYTSGSHIVIGDGGGDRHTLAHELTHVVQQRQGPVAGADHGDGLRLSDPSDRFERAAEENAHRVLSAPTAAPAPTAESGKSGKSGETAEAVQRAVGGPAMEGPAMVGTPAVGTAAMAMPAVQRAGSSRGTAALDRPTRRRRVDVAGLPDFFELPSYTRSRTRGAGGTRSHAVLGPNGYSSRGTDADSTLPPAIVQARRDYGIRFIAGHLLNSDFGGSGTDSKNLTILTPGANSRMKGFDDPVKVAAETLRKVYVGLSRLYCPVDLLAYGIEIEVSTSGPEYVWDDSYPGNCISQFVHCRAGVIGGSAIDDWYEDYLNGGARDRRSDDLWAEVLANAALVRRLVRQANRYVTISNEE